MLKPVALEALLVAVIGGALALAANAVSPRGLRLMTDYFPGPVATPTSGESSAARSPAPAVAQPNIVPSADPLEARLRQRGLQSIRHEDVVALVQAGSLADGTILLVDARGDQPFAKGHIPGAWQFDPYRSEKYVPDLLPRSLAALKVIVYCTGGECEDSELAAIRLRDAGVPNESLYIYTGGMQTWTRQALPVETGPRRAP